ncbi:hypothetical protein GCM10027036_40690 [Flavihumibacter cheonanensis]
MFIVNSNAKFYTLVGFNVEYEIKVDFIFVSPPYCQALMLYKVGV